MKISEKIKKLPLTSGVYQFIGSKNEILYIGRATSLRRRVLQYFQKKLEPRIVEMVETARSLKYIETDSVLEAIILEAKLIKKHWPKYNIKDKDNRSFIYLVFDLNENYPKPLIVRARDLSKFSLNKKIKIFGPFQNANLLKKVLRIIRRIFPYSTCKLNQGKPCFDYQVGLCPGTCLNEISISDYKKNIKNIISIFEGNRKKLIKSLSKDNPELADSLKKINDVSLINNDELINDSLTFLRLEAYDISHFAGQETVGSMVVFIGGEASKADYRLFNIKTVGNNDLMALEEMITRRVNHLEWNLPEIFLIDGGKPQIDHLSKVFKKLQITKPLIGLSKLAGDKLVFPTGTSVNIKNLAEINKKLFQQARDEAHRFANSARRKKMSQRK